jgi:cation diffusion facilitator CzcD-associated flavoprotein CzcO
MASRVVIIGAGFGGIAAAIELRAHGVTDLVVLEAAPQLGGTWYFNRYPGSACDVPSHLYSYSFAQRRDWSRLCSTGPEILDYLRDVADRHGITPLVRTSTRVTSCRLDEATGTWRVMTGAGEELVAETVIVAVGQLHRPSIPALAGMQGFTGHSFHTAAWDHDLDLAGLRVGVVGTGATAVQFVPEIAPFVDQLTIFQRTANWLLPRHNRVYRPWVKALMRLPGVQSLRRAVLAFYIESLTLAIRHPRLIGRALGLRSVLFMRLQLKDPELRRRAWPDYTFGCKRILFSSRYLPTLARSNVELVTDTIAEVTPDGIRTVDGRHRPLDCIIWSTGFRATEMVAPLDVLGAGGRRLADEWRDGPHAHLGMTLPGFPSLFFMYGPNTNTSGGSIVAYLEAQASYIRQALEHASDRGNALVEVRPEVEFASDRETQARFAGTAWTQCDSWYRDERGRIVTNWPGYQREYIRRTARFAPDEFVLTPREPAAVG